MSADNFVGVRQNKNGTYSIFEYGCMSVLDEDCMYLASEIGEIVPSREAALVRAHDLVRDMYVCEYGVIELDPVPEQPCGRCYVCVHGRCEACELEAARMAYAADLGASEWEAFIDRVPVCEECRKIDRMRGRSAAWRPE